MQLRPATSFTHGNGILCRVVCRQSLFVAKELRGPFLLSDSIFFFHFVLVMRWIWPRHVHFTLEWYSCMYIYMRGYRGGFFGHRNPPPPYGCLQSFFACWFAQGPATIWIRSWNSCTKPPLLNVRNPPSESWIRAWIYIYIYIYIVDVHLL